MPQFSIIMPSLNAGKFISEAINSVCRQTLSDWELIIVDGGSSDETIKIIHNYQHKDSRIRLVSEPDKGQYDALIKGFSIAKAEYLAWLNTDDIYPPWSLEVAYHIFQKKDVDWISGLPTLWDSKGLHRTVYPLSFRMQSWIKAGWYHDHFLGSIQQESVMFRHSLYKKLSDADRNRIASLSLAGDFELWRCLAHHAHLHSVPVVLGGFRFHHANRSILQKAEYLAELRSLKAAFPPFCLARILRSGLEIWSSYVTLRQARKEAHQLHQERYSTNKSNG